MCQIQKRFSELVLTDLSKQELIDDGVMSQVLSQEHSGFSFWCGDPFHDDESERFVARYVERGPISLASQIMMAALTETASQATFPSISGKPQIDIPIELQDEARDVYSRLRKDFSRRPGDFSLTV